MQIGEDDLAAAQLLPFGRKRLLHLHDQFGALIYLIRIGDDLGAGGDVFLVGNAGARTRHRLDRDPMPPRCQFPTVAGVRPTRYSSVLISLGTPMNMVSSQPDHAFRERRRRRRARG